MDDITEITNNEETKKYENVTEGSADTIVSATAEAAVETVVETTAEAAVETITETTVEAVSAAETVVGAAAETAAGTSAPEEDRYNSYIDNNVTWNGSSYRGTPTPEAVPVASSTVEAYSNNASQGYGQTYSNNEAQSYGKAYAQPNYGSSSTSSTGYGYAQPGSNYERARANGYYNYQYIAEPQRKSGKKHKFPTALKVILYALLFGVIAAGVFIGTNELYYSINPSAVPVVLPSNDSKNENHDSKSGSKSGANAVASTPLITDISSSATDVSAVVDNVMPSIVSINCTFNAQSFFGYYETSGAGSGIILKQTPSELLIATNNHVVANATSINVVFCDESVAAAVTKGTDSVADLAVISIDLKDLTKETLSAIKVATLGSSDDIKVGQMVVAIGNAMGYGQSTTVGYVSAKDREVTVDDNIMTLLQTDAAINPGNSGGALLNLNGEVIGINSVKYASDEVEGMGFAIPISRATAILDDLASREILKEEEQGYLGVYLQDVTSSIATAYNWPIGIYVAQLVEGGAAEKAGIQVGDIIVAVNGAKVSTSTDLRNIITAHRYGSTVDVTFKRLINGAFEEMTVKATLQKNPELED